MLEPTHYPPHHHDFTFSKESYPSSSLSQQALIRSQTNELLSGMQHSISSNTSSSSSSTSSSSFFDDGATLGDALLPSEFGHQTDEGLSEFGFPGALGDPFMDTTGIIHSMPNSSPNVNLDLNSSSSSSSSSYFTNNLNHANKSNMTSISQQTLPQFPSLYNLPNIQNQQQSFQHQQMQQQSQLQPTQPLSHAQHVPSLPHPATQITASTSATQKSQQQQQQQQQQSQQQQQQQQQQSQQHDERSRKRTRLDDMLDAAVTSTTYSQFGTALPSQSQPFSNSNNTSFFTNPSNSHFPSPISSSHSIPSSSPSSSSTAPFTPLPLPARNGVSQMAISPIVSTSPSSSSSPTTATLGARRAGRGRPPKNSKPVDSDDDKELNGADRETSKKVKHQLTDRVRRAKIKEGMDALRDLVLDPAVNATAAGANSKTVDQATIVVKSVELVRDLKDEVAQLRAKLRQLELKEVEEKEIMRSQSIFLNTINTALPPMSPLKGGDSPYVMQINRAMQQAYQSSPFSGFMASLNAAGVSMWRVNLKGKIMEVNLVFEMISGFSNDQLSGHTPCEPPLNGTLSIMPASFLRLFASVEIINDKIASPDHTRPATMSSSGSSSSSSTQITSSPTSTTHPSSPASDTTDEEPVQQPHQLAGDTTAAATTAARITQHQLSMSDDDMNSHLSPAFQASVAASTFSTAQAPLFSVSLSQLPAIPDNELTSFFPRYLGPPNPYGPPLVSQSTLTPTTTPSSSTPIPQHCGALGMGGECKKYGSNMPDVSQPQPHGCYLVNHLASLPANHCLKLLSRHMTAYGDILESVTTLCLVRDAKGQAEYMLSLTTPDSRRLLRRQQPTN